MQQQWQQLAIQLAEAARRTGNGELIGLYSQYLAEHGIKYSRLAYTVNNLAKSIFNRLFSKKLKRIEVYWTYLHLSAISIFVAAYIQAENNVYWLLW